MFRKAENQQPTVPPGCMRPRCSCQCGADDRLVGGESANPDSGERTLHAHTILHGVKDVEQFIGTVLGNPRPSLLGRFSDSCRIGTGSATSSTPRRPISIRHCVDHNISRLRHVVFVQKQKVQTNIVSWSCLVHSLMMHFHRKYFPCVRM